MTKKLLFLLFGLGILTVICGLAQAADTPANPLPEDERIDVRPDWGLKGPCYWLWYYGNAYYYFNVPNGATGDLEYAQRFSVTGPETLSQICVYLYDDGVGFGDNTLYITIYYDDGSGLPGTQAGQVSMAPGTYNAFPDPTCIDVTTLYLIMNGDFHIGVSTDGTVGSSYENIVADDGTYGSNRSTVKVSDGTWDLMSNAWGIDVNFLIEVYMCPMEEIPMWWKEPDGIYMPDFDQNQDQWSDYCGPTAAADCLWWFDMRFPNWGVVPAGMDPVIFIEYLAGLMSTNVSPPSGTYIDSMQSGLREHFEANNLPLVENTYYEPTYEFCRDQLLACQDVILLLGFWEVYEIVPDVPEPGCFELHWSRIGGHFVTTAGIDTAGFRIGFSDPDKDAAETSLPNPPSRVLGPNHNHPTGHNDGVSVSHDVYDVSNLNISPGGIWEIMDYWYINKFSKEDMQANPHPQEMRQDITIWCGELPPWVYPGAIVTEVEGAVIVCPKESPNPIPGKSKHNIDGYIPDDGDPTGTLWHTLWPVFCQQWVLTGWNDNGDGILSYCDYLEFTNMEPMARSYEHVEWVGPTITLTDPQEPGITYYLDFLGDNPWVNPMVNPVGTWWHEVYPTYCLKFEIVGWEDNGTGVLDYCDYIYIQLEGTTDPLYLHVEAYETDIITVPVPTPGDEYDHNLDGYIPPMGDPTGTFWHELYPNYCDQWILDKWIDNGDGILSFCDTLMFMSEMYPDSVIWKHVEEVTPTIKVTYGQDTAYFDYKCGNFMVDPIENPVGTFWHQIYPNFCQMTMCVGWDDNGTGYLDYCDYISLMIIEGADSGTVITYHVEEYQTDIVTTIIPPPHECPDPIIGDLNLHNTSGYVPPMGDPIGSQWHEIWPNYCQLWDLTSWFDNGDGVLSVCDYIDITSVTDPNLWRKFHVEWIGPTIIVSREDNPDDSIYLEIISDDYAMMEDISDPINTCWHEKYPSFSNTWVIVGWADNGNGYLDYCDYITLFNIENNDTFVFHVESVETDITLKEIVTTPPDPLPEGTNMHNTDGYTPPDGVPLETTWHELYPEYCKQWVLTSWFDNGDGKLSYCDYVDFTVPGTAEWKKFHVEWVGPTLTVSEEPVSTPIFLDYIGFDHPDVTTLIDPTGTYWHEVYPTYCVTYYCVQWFDNGNSILDYCDYLILQNMETGSFAQYHVDSVETDVILKEITTTPPEPLPEGINLHNTEGWRPLEGPPVNTFWHELYPEFCNEWNIVEWIDNGTEFLDVCDTLRFGQLPDSLYHVEWIGPTITISRDDSIKYLDYVGFDNPLIEPITNPVGLYWHEVYPIYCTYYYCMAWMDNGSGFLDYCDFILLQNMTTGEFLEFHVEAVETDIIVRNVTEQACDCEPGEVNETPPVNILDIVYLINYKYKLGPAPMPYDTCSGDANCDCKVNILDIVYLINFKYKDGDPPCTCEDWVAACGWPLRE